MARDVFHMTLSNTLLIDMPTGPDADDMLQALEGIQISVYKRGTTEAVTIYQRSTGATQGPAPESGATGGPNPFFTGVSGSVEFWVNGPLEVDVAIHDTIVPSRVSDRTFGWNAFPVGTASIPSALMASDGGLPLGALGADILRQLHQIGEVIDWWRPAASVPTPTGFEICDGRQIAAGQHDFSGLSGQAINLPDLRNMFVLGADPTKAFGLAAAQGNASADAPGIGGAGGSNAGKDLAHGHGVPGVDHLHPHTCVNHLHAVGTLYTGNHAHSAGSGASSTGHTPFTTGGGGNAYRTPDHGHAVTVNAAGNIGIGGATAAADRALNGTSGVNDRSLNSATNSTTWTADPGTDFRPRYIGLLKLMKVRRA